MSLVLGDLLVSRLPHLLKLAAKLLPRLRGGPWVETTAEADSATRALDDCVRLVVRSLQNSADDLLPTGAALLRG